MRDPPLVLPEYRPLRGDGLGPPLVETVRVDPDLVVGHAPLDHDAPAENGEDHLTVPGHGKTVDPPVPLDVPVVDLVGLARDRLAEAVLDELELAALEGALGGPDPSGVERAVGCDGLERGDVTGGSFV